MPPQNQQLTIIVPVYNEAECLERFRDEMERFLENAPMDTSVCFVNDGSTDNSMEIIKKICSMDPSYTWISLEKNRGLSTAIKAGIDHCRTSLIGYIDADLQTSPIDFLGMLRHIPEYDMVNGIRQKRKDTFVKKISSVIANGFRKRLIGDGIHDTCCPLKIIKSEYAKRIPFFNGMHRFIPALIQHAGGSVMQVPVRHFPRYAGEAKYHLRNRLVGPFVDSLAVAWMKRRLISYKLIDKHE
jgi:glycosyltransferase involved in cell wall biosynthesis